MLTFVGSSQDLPGQSAETSVTGLPTLQDSGQKSSVIGFMLELEVLREISCMECGLHGSLWIMQNKQCKKFRLSRVLRSREHVRTFFLLELQGYSRHLSSWQADLKAKKEISSNVCRHPVWSECIDIESDITVFVLDGRTALDASGRRWLSY